MRYVHTSYSDIDRTLEAFQWARRTLLVILAVALPFAAVDTLTTRAEAPAPSVTTPQTAVHVLPANVAQVKG